MTTDSAWRLAARRSGWLTAATALAWLLLAGLAYRLSGVVGLEGLSVAAMLSLVPGWLVFWGVAAVSQTSDQKNQSMAVLAATCVRLMFVLFGVLSSWLWSLSSSARVCSRVCYRWCRARM